MSLLKAMKQIAETPIKKDQKGYGYNYVGLDQLLAIVNKGLNDNGFFLTQSVAGQGVYTAVYNEEGKEVLESEWLPIDRELKSLSGKSNAIQDLGSQITYLKRYQLQAMFGLNIEGDTDASEFTEDEAKESKPKVAPRKKQTKDSNQAPVIEDNDDMDW